MTLTEYLKTSGTTMSQFAKRMGTTTATISRIADGQVVPRRSLMVSIHRETQGLVRPCDLVGLRSEDCVGYT